MFNAFKMFFEHRRKMKSKRKLFLLKISNTTKLYENINNVLHVLHRSVENEQFKFCLNMWRKIDFNMYV